MADITARMAHVVGKVEIVPSEVAWLLRALTWFLDQDIVNPRLLDKVVNALLPSLLQTSRSSLTWSSLHILTGCLSYLRYPPPHKLIQWSPLEWAQSYRSDMELFLFNGMLLSLLSLSLSLSV